ncbi:hypothetical protein G4Y79_16310 [Phototrophicus methaneseepsis]|uniref:DUF3299 domain-containing protein n=1 Tax=Phototrophicus methaneseepsis TaxID=2710758 RepID=A0A7S8E6L6_9CHLR|nr:hypothetical protein [Phototrophicus methaneseepsis]QPC81263.1 hypothetical protein G4Y79_16310 [Phototrophicus methaneseepsis]
MSLLLTACSSSDGLSAVTPLPEPSRTQASISTPSIATIGPTATTTPTITLLPVITETIDASNLLESTATAVQQSNNTRSMGSSNFALRTPTPSENSLAPGEAREMAMATDIAMAPDLEQAIHFDEQPVPITFTEFYDGFSIRTGLKLSEKLRSLDGQKVIMEGYVAPPLKPKLDFFVLTRIQLAFCPFCSTDVEWPDDIALIYLPEQQILSSEFPVRIIGQMEVGSSVDAETGMVSLVRIYADTIEILQ